jgi:capsular polysaccharide export protein
VRRHFLFLQGLPSPFFRRVASGLAALGHRVLGINLCVGDRMFWHGLPSLQFRGRPADWPAYVASVMQARAITDLVLVGEQRSYHREAISAAHARGIRVTVSDFGYLRPDWITLERDGMGGNSHFPRNPQAIRELAASLPKADLSVRFRDSFWRMAAADMSYHLGNLFLFWLYPHYRRPYRRDPPVRHYLSIGRRLLLSGASERRAQACLRELHLAGARYFVFPLQLENDFQIVAYSPFDGLEDALVQVLDSFAAHCESGTRLVVKVHPLDPGIRNWSRLVRRRARERGLADRIDCIDGGKLDEIIRGSAGMITVNSTAAIRALQLGSPVKALGQAIYDVAGLCEQGPLHGFWRKPQAPDPTLVEAFVDAVAGSLQVRGVFYREPGLGNAVAEAIARLADPPSQDGHAEPAAPGRVV